MKCDKKLFSRDRQALDPPAGGSAKRLRPLGLWVRDFRTLEARGGMTAYKSGRERIWFCLKSKKSSQETGEKLKAKRHARLVRKQKNKP